MESAHLFSQQSVVSSLISLHSERLDRLMTECHIGAGMGVSQVVGLCIAMNARDGVVVEAIPAIIKCLNPGLRA